MEPEHNTNNTTETKISAEDTNASFCCPKNKMVRLILIVLTMLFIIGGILYVLISGLLHTSPPVTTPSIPTASTTTETDHTSSEMSRKQPTAFTVEESIAQARDFSGTITGVTMLNNNGHARYIKVLTSLIDLDAARAQDFAGDLKTVKKKIQVVITPDTEIKNGTIDDLATGVPVSVEIGRSVYEAGDMDVALKVEIVKNNK